MPPLARVLPSGLNATEPTEYTPLVWPVTRSLTGCAVVTSHNRSVPSPPLPVARVLPSGLNATEPIPPSERVRRWPIARPVAMSHSHTRDPSPS